MSTTTRTYYEEGHTMQGQSGRIYQIKEKISAGGYGAVYKVSGDDKGGGKLVMEIQILEAAKNEEQSKRKHFPSLFDQKKLHDRMFIVMTLLGESLADIKRRRQERIFSQNTGYYCAQECLEAIRDLHNLGFVHRDIKPANFVIGQRRKQNFNMVFMVDFGIAREFKDKQGSMKTPREKTKFKGTVRFAPLATHKQKELGRKDDCESWIYMIVDMLDRKRLPWQEVDERKRVEEMKAKAMANPKQLFSEEQRELAHIVDYLTKQHYVDVLDYVWMRDMVRRVALRAKCSLEPPYDWHDNKSWTLR